jgi:hypothetical protein
MGPVYPDINGQHVSFASIELNVAGGLPIPGVKTISYKLTHEIGKLRGTSSHRLGRTRGTEEAEGSIELFKSWEAKLLDLITLGGTVGFAEKAWPVTVGYFELANPQDASLDTLYGVRFHSPEDNHSEGADGLTVTYQMDIMRIVKKLSRTSGLIVGLRPR